MARATRATSLHSVIKGRAPRHTTLRISKRFATETSPVINPDGTVGQPITYRDHLVSTFRPQGRRFSWDVNPSTRPLVAGRWGRDPLAPVQPGYDVANPPGVPAEGESESFTFTVGGLPTYDNFTAEVHVQWPDADVDWDVYLFDAEGNPVGSAAATLANPETARLVDPAPGEYTAVIVNFTGGTDSDWTGSVEFTPPPAEVVTGVKESWKLTCTDRRGRLTSVREVIVDRGETVNVGRACRKPKR